MGCSIDNVGAPLPTMCRLCPDPSTQGVKDWLKIEFDSDSMMCGNVDMSVISSYAKGSDECDSAKQSLGPTCYYNYPENLCMLCTTEIEFMDLCTIVKIEGMNMTCSDLSKQLGPKGKDSKMCTDSQKDQFDTCCYHHCTLCEGQGVKWWNKVEYKEQPLTWGKLDSMLYVNKTEVGTNTCTDMIAEFESKCCYEYPDDPCNICAKDGKKNTLMPNEETEYEGSNFTCAEVNNFVSEFESTSSHRMEVTDMAFDSCCFIWCSLCGEGSRLDPYVPVEIEGEDGIEGGDREESTKEGKCSNVESTLF
jgi:hypothetical protein